MKVLKITDLVTNLDVKKDPNEESFEVLEYGQRYIELRVPPEALRNATSVLIAGFFINNRKDFNFVCKVERGAMAENPSRLRLQLVQYDKESWFAFIEKRAQMQNRVDNLFTKLRGGED